jgi:hypothetical protein
MNTNYSKISGGTMTNHLTGTSGIFNKLTTTNNTSLGVPTI